ncbi:receptor-type tyrosine-protein phosphatase mu-like [Lytechinus pictus]|uniref:receptor-type tyrosine-protein phosphatase mu-like n=1 Tax=Lytechinus pictus TaxID=7653 RepID=UPI0030BA1A85
MEVLFHHFRVIYLLILSIIIFFIPGESVSFIGVTSTPYGAGQVARFAFLVRSGSSTALRAVKLGVNPPSETVSTLDYIYDSSTFNFVSTSSNAVGAFLGRATAGDREETTIIIHASNRAFEPSGGKVTVMANIGDNITLSVVNLDGVNESTIEWQRFSDFSTVQMGGVDYTIVGVRPGDADYYGTFQTGQRASLRYSLIKLIVRACPAGLYSAPLCNLVCPNCYNGGVCSDVTGECICAPGFDGPNCRTECGESQFGWDCSQSCGVGNTLSLCSGSHVCLPDPYGCNCLAGFTGNQCDQPCPAGTYGAGCSETCHCLSSCDRFTGQCSDGQCQEGWSGSNCQVPPTCPDGYYGVNCTDLCHCLDNGPCDRITAICYSTGGLCMPGYASNQVQLADCQSYEGCFDDCSKTCHCQGGSQSCDNMTGVCAGRCQSEWIGPSCQTGVVHSSYKKVNRGQPLDVMCVFHSPKNISSLTMSARLGTAIGPVVDSADIETVGQFYNVTFTITNGETLVYCEVSADGESASSGVNLDYFVLPTLMMAPSVVSYTTENATIDWLGWKAENKSLDGGDGPIIGYNVYYDVGSTMNMAGFVTSDEGNMMGSYVYTVMGLSPGNTYKFSVAAVRKGEGGEGPRGPESQPVTLPLPASTTSMPTTVESKTTTAEVTLASPANDQLLLYIIVPVIIVVCIIIIVLVMVVVGIQRRKRRKMFHDRRERIVLETQAMNEYDDEHKAENHNEAYEEKTYLTANHEKDNEKLQGKSPQRPVSPPPDVPDGGPTEGPPTAKRPPSHKPKPIVVADFANYVQRNRRSRAFEEEWSLLPPDISQPCKIASLPANKVKNRYRNILAYDHSRVVLDKVKGDPNSDYINACYISSFDKEKMYIATQGPNKASLSDFWRMVWMENVHNIVMVTNLFEDGKAKCLQYWPSEGETAAYGNIQVTCHHVDLCHRYVIRILAATNGSESRTLKQYHYQGWPDKGVPKFAGPVLKMIKDFNESQVEAGDVPLLVHCSAGAGRTGVIIAVDSILQEVQKHDQIDIFSFINSMRNNRPQMVQTPEQYAFVHEAVLEGLLCGDTLMLEEDITEQVEQIQWPNPHTDKSPLQQEYEILDIVSSNVNLSSFGSSPENVAKNRYAHVLPEDRCRPYLMTPVDQAGSNNYINASFMSGYSKKNGFIATQMPLNNTVVDFWRLIHDYHISTIVMLNQLTDKSCSIYWPVNTRSVTFGPFTVGHKGSENMNRVKVRTLELQFKEEVHEIRQFEVQTWPSWVKSDGSQVEVDQCMDSVLQLMEYLHRCESQRKGDGPPILVHCMSGTEETGVFCTVMNCLEQLTNEGAVDVFQNLRLLRLSRPNFVPDMDHYLLCYRLLARHQTLYGPAEEKDYDNRIAPEGLYDNVDHRIQSLASEC